MGRHLLFVAAVAATPAFAHAQSKTPITGIGDTLNQTEYQQEFNTFTGANPSVVFNYQVSTTAVTTFLTDTAYQFAAAEIPLTSGQVASYTRGNLNGALIQIPMFGFAVAIPFNNAGLTRALSLTDTQLCGVLSGKITNWNQISTTSGTIVVDYRSDSDPTSTALTRHLSAACTSANSSFGSYPVPVTAVFSQVFKNNLPPPNFVAANGAAAEANALLSTPLSIGFLTPDYTAVAPLSSHTTSLKVAELVNTTIGIAYTPGLTNIALGLANPAPGSTSTTPPASAAAASVQTNWVPVIPDTTKGYPIVAYGTWLLVTCNSSTTLNSDIISFLTDHYTSSSYATLRTNNGFVSTPSGFSTAVRSILLTNKKKYSLNIGNSVACAGKG